MNPETPQQEPERTDPRSQEPPAGPPAAQPEGSPAGPPASAAAPPAPDAPEPPAPAVPQPSAAPEPLPISAAPASPTTASQAPEPVGDGAPARRKPKRSARRLLVEYGLTAIVALVVAFFVQAYAVKPYRVPTPSMATTIQPGDRVLIDRFLFDSRDIERGDIVVFTGPAAVGNQVLLKRVVGLPGDELEITDGVLYVNGVADDAGGVTNDSGETPSTDPAYGQLEEHPEWSLYEPYTVPGDHYYLLGDNRNDSFDSRFWGPVPRASIIGKAIAVYWPIGEVRTLE